MKNILLFFFFAYPITILNAQKASQKPSIEIVRETITIPVIRIDTFNLRLPSPEPDKKKTFSVSEIIAIITNISTVIVVFLTYFLLKETQKTLAHGYEMADRDRKRLETETINTIYHNFRETYMLIISDETGVKLLAENWKVEKDKIKINMYSSFLLNNIHEIFNLKEKEFLPQEVWENYLIDIAEFVNLPFMKARWEVIKRCYPVSFQKFVNDLLNSKEEKPA